MFGWSLTARTLLHPTQHGTISDLRSALLRFIRFNHFRDCLGKGSSIFEQADAGRVDVGAGLEVVDDRGGGDFVVGAGGDAAQPQWLPDAGGFVQQAVT